MPRPVSKYLLFFVFVLTLYSCDRLNREKQRAVHKAKEIASKEADKAKEMASRQADKVFPSYDAYQPDTDHNKKRFKEHLQTDVSPDVKNIYAYGDFIGIDYKVLLSFTCDTATLGRIVRIKKMKLTTKDDQGLSFGETFPWWNTDKMEKLAAYRKGKEAEYWEYLWYDPQSRQAWYEEFSM